MVYTVKERISKSAAKRRREEREALRLRRKEALAAFEAETCRIRNKHVAMWEAERSQRKKRVILESLVATMERRQELLPQVLAAVG